MEGNRSPSQGGENTERYLRDSGSRSSESGDSEEVSESSDESDDEDEPTGVGSEAMQDQPAKEKRPHNPRKPNWLSNDTFVITRVDSRGVPVSPEKAASGYNNAIGVIVRENVSITCMDLRGKDQAGTRDNLLVKLFSKYSFNIYGDDESMNHEAERRVRHKALSMMSKALNTWRNTANSKKGEDFETCIKKKWPQIPHGEWLEFVEYHSDESF